MQTIPLHRFYQVFGIIAAILLALLLRWDTYRHETHLRGFTSSPPRP